MTTTPTPTALTPHPNRARAGMRRCNVRGRGSAVILVIVSIVLMAILGATFVQVARFERISPGGEHIDIAINSVLNEVSVALAEDLYANNGDFFNAAGSIGLDGGGDEPYDYPWTNGSVNNQWVVVFVNDGTSHFAEGGVGDDPWLASTSFNDLSFGAAAPSPLVWGHVSNLTGKFLDNADKDLTGYGTNNPGEIASTALLTTDVIAVGAGANPRLVDADGDGIGDSLWAYAPAAEIAGKRYVYAIRIVDLSARVNVNTAVGQTDSAGNIPASSTASAHGDSPAEVDGLAMGLIFGGGAVGHGEFAQTIAQRTNGVLNPNWGDADQQRRHYWLNGASTVDASLVNRADDVAHPNYDPADAYTEGDLFELLYRNGLNNAGVTTELELDMPNTLRAGNNNETRFDSGTGYGSEAAYMAANARLQFTTASGEVAFAPGVTVTPGDASLQTATVERVLQADVNHSSLTDLAVVIAQTVAANGTFSFANFGHLPTASEVGSQLAANIVDLRDPDNRLTSFNGQFGMEALPFLAEVYSQREYGVPPAGTANGTVPETYTVTYNAVSEPDFAIEVRNPFNRPVELDGVHLFVNGADWGELSSLPTAPAELGVGEVMIIFRNNSGAPENVVGGVTANHFVDLGTTAHQFPTGMGNFSVGLHAQDQTTSTALAWAYSRVDTEAMPRTYTETMAANPLPIEPRPFLEISDQGTGTGLNMLQVRPTDFVQTRTEPSEARGTAGPALGNATKGFTVANDWDTGDQQWLFLDKETSATDNDGRIPNVADILTIPVVGPNDAGAGDNTLADAIAQSAATRLDGFMLDYRRSGTPVINATFDALNVPHAVLLTRRLTTHSPAVDGYDLDGNGTGGTVGVSDDGEAFVPGKINLNTATYDVLRTALPFPSGAMRDAVAQQIIDYRENTGRMAGSRANPGVAYVAELYEEVQPDVAATIGGGGYDPWDWNNYQNPRATSSVTYQPDNITGDREEDIMLSKWLDEVCSTRSDVYAVYMVVQGFPEGNFGAGPVESARVVAVFSRANVRQVGDKAQLIAVRRVE